MPNTTDTTASSKASQIEWCGRERAKRPQIEMYGRGRAKPSQYLITSVKLDLFVVDDNGNPQSAWATFTVDVGTRVIIDHCVSIDWKKATVELVGRFPQIMNDLGRGTGSGDHHVLFLEEGYNYRTVEDAACLAGVEIRVLSPRPVHMFALEASVDCVIESTHCAFRPFDRQETEVAVICDLSKLAEVCSNLVEASNECCSDTVDAEVDG